MRKASQYWVWSIDKHDIDEGDWRFGFSHDYIYGVVDQTLYLERWIFWFGLGTLRLHKFHRSDDDRALHDHPFWFWTFPLTTYWEKYWDWDYGLVMTQTVKRFRFHFRPAKHRHVVKLHVEGNDDGTETVRPVWTICLTGRKTREWGFWPKPTTFVPWRDWDKTSAKNTEARA